MTHNLPYAGCHRNPESNHNSLRWMQRTFDHLCSIVGGFSSAMDHWAEQSGIDGQVVGCLTRIIILPKGNLWMGAFIRAMSATEPKVDISSQRINYTHKRFVLHQLKLFRWQQKVAVELRRPAGWLCCLHAFWRGRERHVSACRPSGKNLFHGAGNRLHGYIYNGKWWMSAAVNIHTRICVYIYIYFSKSGWILLNITHWNL